MTAIRSPTMSLIRNGAASAAAAKAAPLTPPTEAAFAIRWAACAFRAASATVCRPLFLCSSVVSASLQVTNILRGHFHHADVFLPAACPCRRALRLVGGDCCRRGHSCRAMAESGAYIPCTGLPVFLLCREGLRRPCNICHARRRDVYAAPYRARCLGRSCLTRRWGIPALPCFRSCACSRFGVAPGGLRLDCWRPSRFMLRKA